MFLKFFGALVGLFEVSGWGIMNQKPQTLKPKPQTLNPKPHIVCGPAPDARDFNLQPDPHQQPNALRPLGLWSLRLCDSGLWFKQGLGFRV